MRIFLVRHGESEGNLDKSVYLTKPDHAIELSPQGHLQAQAAGEFLQKYMQENPYYGDVRGVRRETKSRTWVSPYTRTRATYAGLKRGGLQTRDSRESVFLVEQQFGLFDGVPDEDLPNEFPVEHAHFQKSVDFEGQFWARPPGGESRFDVTQRIHQFFGTLHRDAQQNGIEDLVIVSHGVTIRAFIMQYCHLPWEWFEEARNPKNCEIRLIQGGEYLGTIYQGGSAEPSRIEEI